MPASLHNRGRDLFTTVTILSPKPSTPVGCWDNTEDDNLAKSMKKNKKGDVLFTSEHILQAQYQNLAERNLENTERHYAHASQPCPAQSKPCS